MLWRQGEALLGAGRAAEAEGVFRGLLARLEAGAAFEAGYQRANVLGTIGRCRRAQGRPSEAAADHRQAARARMRVLVKRILRRYGYPPDLQDAAVQNVLLQAEALSAQMAAAQAAAV